ncbi:MAG: prolyl oligopeptidase family serine peptidase [Planctomycetaceae bacterium]|nr:prolyl oligopeptidase family serine peptidase [Planctomycetaceae bacterium]
MSRWRLMTGTVVVITSGLVAGVRAADPPRTTTIEDPLRPAAIATSEVPAVPAKLAERMRRYQNVRSAGFRGWAPDGRGMLIRTRFGNTTQLHLVETPGGRRRQLTFFDEPVEGRFLPGEHQGALLLSMSRGGDENNQVYLLRAHAGKSGYRLTDGRSRNILGPVRSDGLFAIIHSTRRNGRDTDLYIADPQQPNRLTPLLETRGEYWRAKDWSRDGSLLLINHYVSINESYPAILDVATGKKTAIPIPGSRPAAYGAMTFTPDGRSAYVATDTNGEFRQLARINLKTMKYEFLTEKLPWDVTSVTVEPELGLVAFTTNEDGASGLYLLVGRKFRRYDLPLGIVSGVKFSPDGTRLGFTLSRPDAPADAWAMRLPDGRLTRWTYSEVGGLDEDSFVVPERIRYKTFDGRPVPAYVYRPASASKQTPAAVLVHIHGGPESQYRPYFSPTDQFYLNELGIAVIRPNVRGSAGYGKTYVRLDNGLNREDSVKDIGALLDWIGTQPDLDASRVAVYGGSYGGYMVLGSLVHYSDRLKAGIDVVGIASFETFLKNTKAYRRDLRRAEYGDERKPEIRKFFHRIDPIHNAARIRTALLVAHGVNDPRVPFSEAQQIVPRVRANGQTVWTVYAGNEGHGFRKKANRDYLHNVVARFLQEHLLKK